MVVTSWRRFGFLTLAVCALAAGPATAREGRELRPLMLGWEQHFALEYGPGEYRGRPVVEGYVTNVSPYVMRDVKILVDTLDASGAIAAQRVAYVPGEMPGGSRLFFQVPATPGPAYRVQVFSYDRFESGGGVIR